MSSTHFKPLPPYFLGILMPRRFFLPGFFEKFAWELDSLSVHIENQFARYGFNELSSFVSEFYLFFCHHVVKHEVSLCFCLIFLILWYKLKSLWAKILLFFYFIVVILYETFKKTQKL